MGDESGDVSRLQGILRWSIEQQQQEADNRGLEAAEEMSAERREFLSNALSSMQSAPSEVDVIKEQLATVERVTRSIGEASSSDNRDLEEVVDQGTDALEYLVDLCSDIDNANDMIPLGGFPVIEHALAVNESSLQEGALKLCGTLCQNNPRCQQHAIDVNLLPKYLHLVDKSLDAKVRVQAMFATSCLVKDFDPAQLEFVKLDGYPVLARCLCSGVEKLITKVSFFVTNVVRHSATNAGFVLEHGVFKELLNLLSTKRQQSLEHVATAVCNLIELDKMCMAGAKEVSRTLVPQVEATIASLKAEEDDQYQDEIEQLGNLVSQLA